MLDFVRREKIYILMLLFILAMNVMHAGHVKEEKIYAEKSLSSMTFEEIGATEEKVKSYLQSDRFSARFFRYSILFGFFIFLTSLILNIKFIFSKKPRIDLKDLSHEKPVAWGISDIIRVSIVIIFIGYTIGIIGSFIFKAFPIDIDMNMRMIINTFFIDIFAGVVLLYFIIIKYKEKLTSIGLRSSSFFKNIASGITAYIFIIPLLLAVLLLSLWVLNLLGYSPPPQPVFEAFMEEKRQRMLFFLTIFVSVFGPIVEEMFFRGFMYTGGSIFKRRYL